MKAIPLFSRNPLDPRESRPGQYLTGRYHLTESLAMAFGVRPSWWYRCSVAKNPRAVDIVRLRRYTLTRRMHAAIPGSEEEEYQIYGRRCEQNNVLPFRCNAKYLNASLDSGEDVSTWQHREPWQRCLRQEFR